MTPFYSTGHVPSNHTIPLKRNPCDQRHPRSNLRLRWSYTSPFTNHWDSGQALPTDEAVASVEPVALELSFHQV